MRLVTFGRDRSQLSNVWPPNLLKMADILNCNVPLGHNDWPCHWKNLRFSHPAQLLHHIWTRQRSRKQDHLQSIDTAVRRGMDGHRMTCFDMKTLGHQQITAMTAMAASGKIMTWRAKRCDFWALRMHTNTIEMRAAKCQASASGELFLTRNSAFSETHLSFHKAHWYLNPLQLSFILSCQCSKVKGSEPKNCPSKVSNHQTVHKKRPHLCDH